MERKKITGPEENLPAGHIVLVLSGPKGAVTLEAWPDPDPECGVLDDEKCYGVLGIHCAEPMFDEQQPGPCDYLPEGSCYADQGFRVGMEEAPSILSGYDARAWVTLLSFYRERIDPEGTDS